MKLVFFVLALVGLLLGPIALNVAHAAPAPTAWMVPVGLSCPQSCKTGNLNPDAPGHTHIGMDTGVWRSEGYDPGTSWPTLAFGCPGQNAVWHGEDDDDTGLGIKLAAPTAISGLRYRALGWSGYPHPYPHRNAIDLSMDGIHWTHVADLSATLPFNQWTWVQVTFPPVMAQYVREFVETDGSFTNELGAQLLVPASTARSC